VSFRQFLGIDVDDLIKCVFGIGTDLPVLGVVLQLVLLLEVEGQDDILGLRVRLVDVLVNVEVLVVVLQLRRLLLEEHVGVVARQHHQLLEVSHTLQLGEQLFLTTDALIIEFLYPSYLHINPLVLLLQDLPLQLGTAPIDVDLQVVHILQALLHNVLLIAEDGLLRVGLLHDRLMAWLWGRVLHNFELRLEGVQHLLDDVLDRPV